MICYGYIYFSFLDGLLHYHCFWFAGKIMRYRVLPLLGLEDIPQDIKEAFERCDKSDFLKSLLGLSYVSNQFPTCFCASLSL